MTQAYINQIATAVPPADIHEAFVGWGRSLLHENRRQSLLSRMAERSQIEHRWSFLQPSDEEPEGYLDRQHFYRTGRFPSTAKRMRAYEDYAPTLALEAVGGLQFEAQEITHLIVVSCTGFSAPGLDLWLIQRLGLASSVERTMVGFMGCYAAMNGLKLARHIVRSEPQARVLLVCIELCTLHLQESRDLEQVLSFLLFGDGCAATIVSASPHGVALDRFRTLIAPQASQEITWTIGDGGFDMFLSGRVPLSVGAAIKQNKAEILGDREVTDVDLWAVHPGGRSILDAVDHALELPTEALTGSREVLRRYGNMSSATILFVFKELLTRAEPTMRGCGLAFGPGLTAETLLFSIAA